MGENKSRAKQFFDEMGETAVKLNRKIGYDTGFNRQRTTERYRAVMKTLRRLLPSRDATMRDLLELAAKRFATLKKTVDAAEKETPSIARFEKVIRAMVAAVLESAKTQDSLFELSGAFRRGFDILAERPKQPKVASSTEDLLFTARERKRITKAIWSLYDVFISCGHNCSSVQPLLPDPKIPERVERIVNRYRPDKSAPISRETCESIIAETYFLSVRDGLWAYNGDLFRDMKRFAGIANADCLDPEDVLANAPDDFLDLSLADLIASPGGQALGVSLISAIASGDGSPEMASARADDIGSEITNTVLRNKLARGSERMNATREELLAILKEAEGLRQILTSEEEKQWRREAPDPEKAEAKRVMLLTKVEENIKLIHDNLELLDKEAALCQQCADEIPPPCDLAVLKPVAVPEAAPPAPPTGKTKKVWLKYAGQTLKCEDGSWIRIEKDGVNVTCPTLLNGVATPCTYAFTNDTQAVFLNPLLECFAARSWHKPTTNQADWQGKCFKRGNAKNFLAHNHIEHWYPGCDGKGGCQGAIRLHVAKPNA